MTTSGKCPNPNGCDGELYARADASGEEWCPKCGYVLHAGKPAKAVRHCPNPDGCDGELYARVDASGEEWCPTCGYVFRRPGTSSSERAL
ncbi:MAG TPA: hypothetical protein VFS34_03350 [Thermoanaerobaculia bacterium]|nr:hypothetical protein [Thermoanaerobaculia bacterium]